MKTNLRHHEEEPQNMNMSIALFISNVICTWPDVIYILMIIDM